MKKPLHTVIILSILVSIAMADASARIYKKVHADGTIEYYNKSAKHIPPVRLTSKYDRLIDKISRHKGVDPYLIKCIIQIESNFKADAVSVAGAMGLMQLMQDTARYYQVEDPLNPEENLNAGISHVKSLLKFFDGDIPLALAAYHAGIGRVKKNMSIPPIQSTIEYVNKVMFLYKGKKHCGGSVKRLYKRIEKDGTIIIYSK